MARGKQRRFLAFEGDVDLDFPDVNVYVGTCPPKRVERVEVDVESESLDRSFDFIEKRGVRLEWNQNGENLAAKFHVDGSAGDLYEIPVETPELDEAIELEPEYDFDSKRTLVDVTNE